MEPQPAQTPPTSHSAFRAGIALLILWFAASFLPFCVSFLPFSPNLNWFRVIDHFQNACMCLALLSLGYWLPRANDAQLRFMDRLLASLCAAAAFFYTASIVTMLILFRSDIDLVLPNFYLTVRFPLYAILLLAIATGFFKSARWTRYPILARILIGLAITSISLLTPSQTNTDAPVTEESVAAEIQEQDTAAEPLETTILAPAPQRSPVRIATNLFWHYLPYVALLYYANKRRKSPTVQPASNPA